MSIVTKMALLGPEITGLSEEEKEQVMGAISQHADDCSDGEGIVIHSPDDEIIGQSIVKLMQPHDGLVHQFRYALSGEVSEHFCGREAVMGIDIDARRIIQHANWIGHDGLRRIAARSLDDVVQARDIALLAAAARDGATACISIDARWIKHPNGVNHRIIAKRFGMDVVRLIFSRAEGKIRWEETT